MRQSRPRAARAGGRQAVTDFDGNTSDEVDEEAPYAQPKPEYVQRASSDPVTETPDDTLDEVPRESLDDPSDELPDEPPEKAGDESPEAGDEWSPEGSGNESRKRDRDDSDEDSDEPVAKRTSRTANQTSESSEDSDVGEPSDSAPAAFDEATATADAKKKTNAQLKAALKALGEIQTGVKATLVERLVAAQRAAAGVKVERDPEAPPPVPRPTGQYIYDRSQVQAIEKHILAHGWTVETVDESYPSCGKRSRKKYISPEGTSTTSIGCRQENNTLNVVVWWYFPEFLKVNSQERAAELAWLKAKEEACWEEVPALYGAGISPPLKHGDGDPTTSKTSTPNGGTSYSFVGDASGLLQTMTSGDWVVQQHKNTRCRRFIPPKNLATSSEPYYSLLDVAHDFYHSFLTTFTYEPPPPVEPQPHAKAVSKWLKNDGASNILCLGEALDNLTLRSDNVREDIDEESNETNPFTTWWKAPPTPRFVLMEEGALCFHPDDPGINKSHLSGEFSLNTSRNWRSAWPPMGLLRRLKNGDYVNITRLEDARVGDLYVIQDGMYKNHTLYVSDLSWRLSSYHNSSASSRFTTADVDKFKEDGILPAACEGKTVVIGIRYSFVNPLRVNHSIPTCFAWTVRKLDGTALSKVLEWKEMIAQRPYGLCCSTCDNFVGKPVYSKDGEVLYYQTVTQFEQDGVDPRHKRPKTVGIAYREWELRQHISEWKCTMCHVNKSVSEKLRPDEKHLASGTVGAWPYSLPPWKK